MEDLLRSCSMSYKIKSVASFDKDFKRLLKRYHSLPDDIKALVKDLRKNPMVGVSLGHGVHKIRLAIHSKGGGKSGGIRVITYVNVMVEIEEGVVYLLAMYDKSDQDSIADKAIKELLKQLPA